jgi:ApaG protein
MKEPSKPTSSSGVARSSRYESASHGIRIQVRTEVIKERTVPEQGLFGFAYYVMIFNERPDQVQLLNRHWRVFSGERQIADVKGEGVVGEQPELEAGELFRYASWTLLNDPQGSMEGAYTFRNESGDFFDVQVPRFEMLYMDEMVLH